MLQEKALGIISPGVGVSDGWEPATSNLGLLEDQQVFLTTKPSLQHLNNVFSRYIILFQLTGENDLSMGTFKSSTLGSFWRFFLGSWPCKDEADNLPHSATSCQKLVEVGDECKLCIF